MNREFIENLVGTKISDMSLYTRAFTHKSYNKDDYERLEFIGDSVLKFVVTKYLFDMFPKEDEGFLTRARTKIERSETLAGFSRNLGFNKFIMMDEKALRNEWNNNDSILEDVFEAFVGAIYLDKGLVYARDFIIKILLKNPISFDDDNYKDQIMRYCQSKQWNNPVYINHPIDDGGFVSLLIIQDKQYGTGRGSTKKRAEQNAAQYAIKHYNLVIPIHASKSK
jgi:ribonuclease-3